MITVDTNVLLRLFIRDNPEQVRDVQSLVMNARDIGLLYLPRTTLVELVWMLGRYKISRAEIIKALEFLLDSSDFVIGDRPMVTQAFDWYKSGKADFADYLMHAEGIALGSKEIATFDVAFAREDKRRKHPRHWVA
jgi:predicted nucleic-acid-binding protein